jgi:phage/plasmid-like protein (TIGR03299 family)
MIDQTTGKAAMAFMGETPWHGLGQELTPDADLETWRKEAGLDFTVLKTPVNYVHAGGDDGRLFTFNGRYVLYRDDTHAPLSVVSGRYRIVQPAEVLDFFKTLVDTAGFQLETAGALDEGRKIWGLARVNDGAPIIGQDIVRPYLLLATSFDGTLSTTAKFTSIRVVCNNTLTMSAGGNAREGAGQTEIDRTEGAVVQSVRVAHSERFDPDEVRARLGVVLNAWDRFKVQSRLLAERSVTEAQADKFVFDLIEPTLSVPAGQTTPDVRSSRGYKRIMELFGGEAKGYDMAGWTAWGLLNAVTEYVDHERGRSDSSRMDSAWFGSGEGLKNKAFKMANDLVLA